MRLHSLCCLLAAATATARKDPRNATRWFADDTWFVLVGASRYFANYRHAANVLALRKFARAAERTLSSRCPLALPLPRA